MTADQLVGTVLPSPLSTPGMTPSRSSVASSFQSQNSSDDGSVLTDMGHFEDIGLEDDKKTLKPHSLTHSNRRRPSPSPLFSSKPLPVNGRALAAGQRSSKPQRPSSNLNHYAMNPRSTSLSVLTDPRTISFPKPRGNNSSPSLPQVRRNRSVSPGIALNPRDPNLSPRPRRSSWQPQGDRKSSIDLEKECDDDDEDDIPDGIVLDNVPLSPRPAHDRPISRSPSPTPSSRSERPHKERVRSVGNGTPAIAQAQGSLRSPAWKQEAMFPPNTDKPLPARPPKPQRAQSWNVAHAELNAEARALTEKLEEHADEAEEYRMRRPSTWNLSHTSSDYTYDKKDRIKSTPELPPLRKTNIMIDPLPVSKEKEAVLSRTRPSWLPPKDPVEERRHLKQYQKMMVASAKADERREAARRVKIDSKDSAVDHSMQVWENGVLPRWNDAIRERRTRELWWRGVAPRSRGPVWTRAIGNQLGLTEGSFTAALSRAKDMEDRVKTDRGDSEDAKRVKWFQQIRKEASENTWSDLRIFHVSGPLHQSLVDVLSAYAMYRNDIGYVSGSNTIAALLLLNLPNSAAAFVSLANLLNRPLPLSFFTFDPTAQASVYNLIMQKLSKKSAALHEHLSKTISDFEPAMYLQDVLTSLFTAHLAVEETARLWDVYVFEGDEVMVWAAVAFLLTREMVLLGTKTVEDVQAVLAKPRADGQSKQQAIISGSEDEFMKLVRETSRV